VTVATAVTGVSRGANVAAKVGVNSTTVAIVIVNVEVGPAADKVAVGGSAG
jgi:hypothetical protein